MYPLFQAWLLPCPWPGPSSMQLQRRAQSISLPAPFLQTPFFAAQIQLSPEPHGTTQQESFLPTSALPLDQ